MAYPNGRMDSEERARPRSRRLLVHRTRAAMVRMGVAVGCNDGSCSPCGGSERNRAVEHVSPLTDVDVYLQECSRRIRAPTDCSSPDGVGHGGEYDSLACPTAPSHSAIGGCIRVDSHPSTKRWHDAPAAGFAATDNSLGQLARRLLRRHRFIDHLRPGVCSRRADPKGEASCVDASATVCSSRCGMCSCEPHQSVWISPSPPCGPISRHVLLRTEDQ